MEKVYSSFSKTRNMLDRAYHGLGPGPWGAVASESEKPTLHPKATVCLICNVLEIPCIPLVKHFLISLLLSLQDIAYKVLYFLISVLGIRCSLCQTFQSEFYLLIFYPPPSHLRVRSLPEEWAAGPIRDSYLTLSWDQKEHLHCTREAISLSTTELMGC